MSKTTCHKKVYSDQETCYFNEPSRGIIEIPKGEVMKKVVDDKKSEKTVTFRMSEDWMKYVDNCSAILTKEMGVKVTRTWVITCLMEQGQTGFETKYKIKRQKRA